MISRSMPTLRLVPLTLLAAGVLCAPLPGAAAAPDSARVAPPVFAEVPDASAYLTEQLAKGLLRAETVTLGADTFHIPVWSACAYSGQGVRGRQTGFTFKFMLREMFDVGRLEREQLEFNATFAVGGEDLTAILEDLGALAFAFEGKDRTTLLVLTGIRGPEDGAGRPQDFVATYFLGDPEVAHAERLEELVALARTHLDRWYAAE